VNYYELLNITRDADNSEIKRAYFSAVKLHPPDFDPEGFKAVRIAYETLFFFY
jgi:molecular chaperone DnaJ